MAQSLADLVKTHRSNASLSQEALAERAGISARTIGDIETGFARSPRLLTVMLIAEALGLGDADRERLRNALPRRTPKPAGAPQRPSVPEQVTLLGRTADIAAVEALVARPDVRLVTLAGPAGVGKTSLAVSLAHRAAERFSDGVAYVALAAVRDPAFVAAEVAAVLGIRESGGSVEEAVFARLGAQRALVVLDNFEHLMPAARWVATLLAACPGVCVLTTSREMLRLRAERVYAVRPLAAPAAIDLFVERAQAARSDFTLTPATDTAVAGIVARLEGLPLAIELAASRLTLLPPAALLARLERRLPLLADGPIDVPQRQQTMHAAIAWSYDLLAADEQQLFGRLAVFSGGATIDAVAAVADTGGPSATRSLLSRLGSLADKSLITVADEDGEPRLRMLELLREFALERLEQSGEFAAVQQRHAQYFMEFAQTADIGMTGPQQAQWMRRLDGELPNLRAALTWTTRAGRLETGLRIGGALGRFWWLRGYLTEGRTWLDGLLGAARTAAPGVASAGAQACALQANGQLMNVLGDFTGALAACDRALARAREAGDERVAALTLNSRGIAHYMLGDFDAACAAHEEALAVRRALGDDFGIGSSLGSLAGVLVALGRLPEATALCEESVALLRRAGGATSISVSLSKLGACLQYAGDYERASDLFAESLALQRELDDKANMLYSYYFLARLARKRGRPDEARVFLRDAFDLLRLVDNKSALSGTLEELAMVQFDAGRLSDAARLLGAANALRGAINSPRLPNEDTDAEECEARVRALLGAEAFAAESRAGARTPLETLVAGEREKLEV